MGRQEDLQSLKKNIEAQIEEIQGRLGALEEASKPVAPDPALGEHGRMEEIREASMNEAKLEAAQAKLRLLKHALKKFDTNDYGDCETCGNEIQLARLQLMPETTQCVTCAEQQQT